MKTPLNVSRGQQLDFAANSIPVSGTIAFSAESELDECAAVEIVTDMPIPDMAQLSIPGTNFGGCGLASPKHSEGKCRVTLSIPYSGIDLMTLGK